MLKLILFIFLNTALGQVIDAPVNPVDFQQNPSGIQWKVIDTTHFEIIFPEEVAPKAQRVAWLLERFYFAVSRSMEVLPPKISLVLQNQSVMSNGFVTLAPRRSEWYLAPSLDPELSNTEWLETLAVHEFRHVVQFERGREGVTKAFEVFLGEIGHALGLGFTAPPWLFEGDAVGVETALTPGGRGRLPLFERDLRTLLLSGKDFSYDKAHLGSFKDYIPSHYVYGYFYTSYIRNEKGDLSLSRLMYHSSQNAWNPLSFYNTMDDTFRKDFEEFYRDVMKDLVEEWKKKFDELSPTPFAVKSPKKERGWTNYLYPQFTESGDLVSLRTGLSYLPQFVRIRDGKEVLLFTPSPLQQEYPFRLRKDRLAYVEFELDPRWGYRDYGRLKVFDVSTGKHVLDVRHTKYRLAVLDHNGKNVAAVEWGADQTQKIVILGPQGKLLRSLTVESSQVITSLDWWSEEKLVLVTKDEDSKKHLLEIDASTGSVRRLLGPLEENLGFVTVSSGKILLESPRSGIDNVFVLEGSDLRQLTSAPFGAYAPTIFEGKLFYSNYTVKGHEIVRKELPWEEEQRSSGSFVPVYHKYAIAESKGKLSLTKAPGEFKSRDYSQFKNALNFHSWVIIAPPLSPSISLAAFSRDILNKFSLSVGADYNLNERTLTGFVSAAWSHLYPVFDLRAAYGNRRQDVIQNGRERENTWEEGTTEAGVQIPWQKLSGRYVQSFTARAFAGLIKVTNKISRDRTEVNDGVLFSPGGELTYSVLSRMARRDLYPRLGLSLSGHLEEGKDITGVDQRGSLQSLDGRIYLPGVTYHHAFFHQLAYERQRDEFYQYSSFIFYPRGTRSIFLQEFTKYSGNYSLPLFYPDWNLSRYLYLKRLSLNAFYDSLSGRNDGFNYRASSAGWELLLDTNFLRLALPVSWGVRGSYVIEGIERDQNYEVFLNSLVGVF